MPAVVVGLDVLVRLGADRVDRLVGVGGGVPGGGGGVVEPGGLGFGEQRGVVGVVGDRGVAIEMLGVLVGLLDAQLRGRDRVREVGDCLGGAGVIERLV